MQVVNAIARVLGLVPTQGLARQMVGVMGMKKFGQWGLVVIAAVAVLSFSNGVALGEVRTLATEGQFIAKCLGCHGRKGVSGYSEFPNLASLNQPYLLSQLLAFRERKRVDHTMDAMPWMVKDLTDDELYGLAEIFSRLPAEDVARTEMSSREQKLFDEGKALIAGNSTTCRFCHLGNPTNDGPSAPIYPNLVGQQNLYLVNQIRNFRDKKRWNPIMNSDLVGQLSDNEIEAIAVYFRYLKAR